MKEFRPGFHEGGIEVSFAEFRVKYTLSSPQVSDKLRIPDDRIYDLSRSKVFLSRHQSRVRSQRSYRSCAYLSPCTT